MEEVLRIVLNRIQHGDIQLEKLRRKQKPVESSKEKPVEVPRKRKKKTKGKGVTGKKLRASETVDYIETVDYVHRLAMSHVFIHYSNYDFVDWSQRWGFSYYAINCFYLFM